MSAVLQKELEHLPEGFSAPTEVFGEEPVGLVGGLVLCTVFGAGGFAAAVYAMAAHEWGTWILWVAGGFAVFTLLGLSWFMLTNRRVLICPEGFVEVSIWGARGCAWEYIHGVWQKVTD